MGCPTEVQIGDNLVFSIVTHNPGTGAATDATGSPAYRIYEDETDPPILTGSMAKLDDDDTTGFYTELIACTAVNGFEDGKTYTIYITATVSGITGGISYSFKATNIHALVTAGNGSSSVTITIQDQATAKIEGASVQIWNTALDLLVTYNTTDSNGQAAFSLDDGNYKIKVRKSGYSFTETYNLTVSGTTAQTISGTSTIPSAPLGNQSCRVYEYLYKIDGTTPVDSVDSAKCRIVSLPYSSGGVLHTDNTLEGTYDSSTGLLYWDVVRGSKCEFDIQNKKLF
jgi:hypothetical protein